MFFIWIVLFSSLLGAVYFVFRLKTAYAVRISDWSSDVCSSDLVARRGELCAGRRNQYSDHQPQRRVVEQPAPGAEHHVGRIEHRRRPAVAAGLDRAGLFAAIRGDRLDADAADHRRQPRRGAIAAIGRRRGGLTRGGGDQGGRAEGGQWDEGRGWKKG